MLSRKFWAWVGVGAISAVAIPVVAGPHLAKMVQRRPAAVQRAVAPKAKRVATTKPAVAKVVAAAKPVELAKATPKRIATAVAASGKASVPKRASAKTARTTAASGKPGPAPRVSGAAATARKMFH